MKVAIRRGNYADINCDFGVAAYGSHSSFLKDAQEFDLASGRNFSNFVQKDSSGMGRLEETFLLLVSSRERPSFVPKEFRFEQAFAEGATID